MPIYEYRCVSCQKDHEIIQKVNDLPLKICPACGGALEKVLSRSSFQLRGGGWYKDGYTSSKGEKGPSPACPPEKKEKCGCSGGKKK